MMPSRCLFCRGWKKLIIQKEFGSSVCNVMSCIFSTLCIRCFSRDWRIIDYGICDLMDLLTEIPDTTITITHQATDTIISVPKRGQYKLGIKNTFFVTENEGEYELSVTSIKELCLSLTTNCCTCHSSVHTVLQRFSYVHLYVLLSIKCFGLFIKMDVCKNNLIA